MDLTNWIKPAPKEEKIPEAIDADRRLQTADSEEKLSPPAALPWCEKYRPETISDFVGNPNAIGAVKKWADTWCTGKPKKKALLVYGNVGTGKTCLSYAIADECGWDVVEMNASDKRTKDIIEKIAGYGSQTHSFSGKTKLILVEEIEGLSGVRERGAGQALAKVIKETRAPIIITTNDVKNKNVGSVSKLCEKVPLKKISPAVMSSRLAWILDQEGIKIDDKKTLEKIAENSGGDLRCAINDLQAAAQGESVLGGELMLEQRDRPIDIYKALQSIFKCTDYKKCRRILWDLNEEPRSVVQWMDENVPVEYPTRAERSRAFNELSRADIFLGRVMNRQYWGFLRYVNDLTSVGVSFAKDKPYYDFKQYKFPSLIWKMGASRGKRAKDNAVATKMSPVVHSSKTDLTRDYLPLLRRVSRKDREAADALVAGFDLSEEEMQFLD